MTTLGNVHVMPRPDGWWETRREGLTQASFVTASHWEAIEVARKTAALDHVEVVMHAQDGTICGRDVQTDKPDGARG